MFNGGMMEDDVSTAGDPQMPARESIQITYEVLFEILRKEKNTDELPKLDPEFFFNTVNYMKDKLVILTEQQSQQTLFSADEKEKTEMQIKNIKKILREIYDRRERKIMNMAINKSRIAANIVDTSALLEEERMLFEQFVNILGKFRQGVVENMVNARLPRIEEAMPKIEEKKDEYNPLSTTSKLVRFIKPVPRFVGKELENYGPYSEEDIANLPSEIADVLIVKGRAEEIRG